MIWAARLTPFLIGEAQAAYRALGDDDASDCPQVRAAILDCLEITNETHWRRFRFLKMVLGERPWLVAQCLKDLAQKWFQP